MPVHFQCDLCTKDVSEGLLISEKCMHTFHQDCLLEHHFKNPDPAGTCPRCAVKFGEILFLMLADGAEEPYHFSTYNESIASKSLWENKDHDLSIAVTKFPKTLDTKGFGNFCTSTEKEKAHKLYCNLCFTVVSKKFLVRTGCKHSFHLECFQRGHFDMPFKCRRCFGDPETNLYKAACDFELYFFEETQGKWFWAATFPKGIEDASQWMPPGLEFNMETEKEVCPEKRGKYACSWEQDGVAHVGIRGKGPIRCVECNCYMVKGMEVFERQISDLNDLVHVQCALGPKVKIHSESYSYLVESPESGISSASSISSTSTNK